MLVRQISVKSCCHRRSVDGREIMEVLPSLRQRIVSWRWQATRGLVRPRTSPSPPHPRTPLTLLGRGLRRPGRRVADCGTGRLQAGSETRASLAREEEIDDLERLPWRCDGEFREREGVAGVVRRTAAARRGGRRQCFSTRQDIGSGTRPTHDLSTFAS